ncbi:hypothetical protein BPO_1290 [Bergeyella porcorum]|uniref:Uncharacterized protein n=1 Tax=Bergeyella porcorum TaxID=1735111 RepID=A0AAU0EZS2_9FLAO
MNEQRYKFYLGKNLINNTKQTRKVSFYKNDNNKKSKCFPFFQDASPFFRNVNGKYTNAT